MKPLKRVRLTLPIVLALVSYMNLEGQTAEEQENLEALIGEVLRVNIVARLLPEGEDLLHFTSSKLTIPGRPVTIGFRGENIVITANLTPYLQDNGKLLLVAQGQVWSSESSTDTAVRYLSSLKSIPITLGEKVVFFPLGIPDDMSSSNSFNIVLEIEILPFSDQ